MTERIKIENVNGKPKEGIFITKKDQNSLLISICALLLLMVSVLKTKSFLNHK